MTLLLVWRGLRARAGASVAVLLVAAVAVATAVAGPVYLHAGGDSITRSTLSQASTLGNEVAVTSQDFSWGSGTEQVTRLQRSVRAATPTQVRDLFAAPILGLSDAASLGAGRSTTLVWRGGQCTHLRITAGACPVRTGDALVSTVFAAAPVSVKSSETVMVSLFGSRWVLAG